MRLIVFFDLPTETADDMRNYRHFRRFLVKSGFLMMQKSVYCKMVLNASAESTVYGLINKNKPPKGIVQLLVVTEKQFSRMEYIVGEFQSEIINSDEKLVIL